MSLSVPVHDRVGEFLLLLETTNGRDKLCRFIQFASKFAKWKEETSKQRDEKMVQRWGNLSVSMSTVRKVLRFFRTLAVLRAIHRSWPASSEHWSLELALNIAAKLCLASYFFFDHAMYAQRIGLWQPDNEQLTLANQLTEGSWLGEIVFTLLEQLVRLAALANDDSTVLKGVAVVGSGGVVSVAASSVSATQLARHAALRSIVRNGCDLPIALHFLGLTGNYPHGYFGALGAVSSLISLYEMWPSVLVPKVATA